MGITSLWSRVRVSFARCVMPRSAEYKQRQIVLNHVRVLSMADSDTGKGWIEALKRGDEEAAQQLFEVYFRRLVGLARKKLQALPPRVADASGVVQSALNSFFQGVRRNAFPRLNDREDLWRLLVVITARKASHRVRDELCEKRGAGRVRGESVLNATYADDFNGLAHIIDDDKQTPEMAAILNEELSRRLEQLDDDMLKEIAVLKLQDHTNAEIAERFGVVPRTVERKLQVIRTIWENES